MSKIIALLPFRNEEKFIGTCVTSLCHVVDKIVAIDDFSTDKSREILTKISGDFRVPVDISYGPEEQKTKPVEKLRAKLLQLGREAGGTHFVCLDADEAFTKNFCQKGKQIINKLAPGQKLTMQWLAMWKSLDHFRDDQSVWSNNFKDFVVCDDGNISAEEGEIHKGRTPGPNTEETLLKLNPKHGAVFHFQFSDWNGFQMKQAWYRCFERTLGRDPQSINQTYRITMEDPNAVVTASPTEWMWPTEKLPVLNYEESPTWHLTEIKKLFNIHGIDKFKDLEIWHIKELADLRREDNK